MKWDIVEAVKAYLNNNSLENPRNSKELVKSALEQALQPILYPVYKLPEYKKYYISACVTQEKFKALQKEVSDIFNENEIDHLYFKGSILCYIYPDSTVRTRGDIDLYIRVLDLEKVTNLLLDNGFKKNDGDCMHHISFEKNGLELEIHFNLFDEYGYDNYNLYFKKPFDLANKLNGYSYELNNSDHFLYCICHFHNHLLNGCGIRYILDFYYMLEKYNIDFDYLHKGLDKLNLNTLYNNILNSIYYLTGKKYDNIDIIDIEFFINYLLTSGIHGFADSNNYEENKSRNKKNKFRYALSRLFMNNREYRLSLYPRLGKHWYTYPICFTHHLFKLLFTKTPKAIKLLFTGNKKTKEQKEFMKKMGF